MPVDDFLEWGATRDEYFAKLRARLAEPVVLDRIRHAYRWYNLYHLGATLDLSDLVPSSGFGGLPKYRIPSEADSIEEILIRGRDAVDINLERQKRSQQPGSVDLETAELRRQLRRLVHFLFTGKDSLQDFPLIIVDENATSPVAHLTELSRPSGTQRFIAVQGSTVKLWIDSPPDRRSADFVRESPLIARLAPLCGVYLGQEALEKIEGAPGNLTVKDTAT